MTDNPQWSEVGEDHPMTRLLHSLMQTHRQICAEAGISPWEFCVVLANVQGLIIGQSQDMPTAHALQRIGDLGDVARGRMYEERAAQRTDTKQ
jgi:hypothetical protein